MPSHQLRLRCHALTLRCAHAASARPFRLPRTVGLPDSLLSRFDLLFIVLDPKSMETDRAISGHVLQMHRTSKTGATPAALAAFGGRGGDVVEDRDEDDDHGGAADANGQTPMYVKFERGTLQTGPGGKRGKGKVTQTVLSTAFIKKYIRYAKQRVAPTMGAEACARIATEYANLRQRASGTETRCLPVTPRTLETMIRYATHGRALHPTPHTADPNGRTHRRQPHTPRRSARVVRPACVALRQALSRPSARPPTPPACTALAVCGRLALAQPLDRIRQAPPARDGARGGRDRRDRDHAQRAVQGHPQG